MVIFFHYSGLPGITLFLLLLLSGCAEKSDRPEPLIRNKESLFSIHYTEGRYELLKEGKPFYIQGTSGDQYWREAVLAGANTVRTYGMGDLEQKLKIAETLGLSVIVGTGVPPIRAGYSYKDSQFLQSLESSILDSVEKYKDHPSILAWGLGNEVTLTKESEIDYWIWVNHLTKKIHDTNQKHLVIVSVSQMQINYKLVKKYAPEVDILGINVFNTFDQMLSSLDNSDCWNGPILITEWAPMGYWEAQSTEWNAPIEASDEVKSHQYVSYYQSRILSHKAKLLGSVVFYWGQKQERTPTWFSLFSASGYKTAVVDELTNIWTGSPPANFAPTVKAMMFTGRPKSRNQYFQQFDTIEVVAFPSDVEGDLLHVSWEMLPEGNYSMITGGDFEKYSSLTVPPYEIEGDTARFLAPQKSGAYRIYVHVHDSIGGAGYHNLPFFVSNGNPLQ